jgi:hypothetical protein
MTQENLHASFHNKKQAYKQLSDIDGCFMKIAGNLINPQDKIAPIFLLRSHSAYRAMCALALSGQIIEAFALGRLCIEYAGYGILINSNQNNFSVWFDKSRSRRHKKAFSDAFTQAKVRGCIDKHDKKLAEVYQQLYERCIDAGAHPNGLAVSGSMKITDDPDADLTHIEQIYLHRDGLAMDHGQKSAAQIGICSLHIFQFIFKERFSLLGLTNLLQELRQGL